MIRIALTIVFACLLSSCGFQLRDAIALPADMGPLQVVSRNPYSPLAESLSQALTRAGAEIPLEGSADDVATLQIVSEAWRSTPLSVDAFGRAQEYTLRYAVFFVMKHADGSVIVPQQGVELMRDYVSSPTSSIGTASEQELLANEMRREMVASILRRIDAIARAPVPVSTPAPAPEPAP